MTRTGSALRGLATDLAGTGVLTVLQFLVVPVYLGFIGSEVYGLWLALLALLGWLMLCDLGLGVALLRLVAGSDGASTLSRVLSAALALFSLAGALVLVVGLTAAPFVVGAMDLPASRADELLRSCRDLVLLVALSQPLSAFTETLNGLQRMAFVNTARTLAALGGMALTILLLWREAGLQAFVWGQALVLLAPGVASAIRLRGLQPEVRLVDFRGGTEWRQMLAFGGVFQLGRLANTVATSTDSLIIAANLGGGAVASYNFTSKLAVLASQSLASKLPNATLPGMAELFAARRLELLQSLFLRLTGYATRLALLSATFIALANERFVALWVGPEHFGGAWLCAVFVYWALQDSLHRGICGVLFAGGQIRGWTIASTVEAVLNLGLSLALVGPLGLFGVALATSIARTLTTAWYAPWQICRQLELPVRRFLVEGLAATCWRSLPSCLVMLVCARAVPEQAGWWWLAAVGAAGVSCNLLTFEAIVFARWISRERTK